MAWPPPCTMALAQRVRQLIDTSLTADDVSDLVIEDDLIWGDAARQVALRDGQAPTRTGAEADTVLRAIIYLAAAILVPRVPVFVSEKDDIYQYQRTPLDAPGLVVLLRSQAEAELATLLGAPDPTPYRPTLFGVGCGRRGF